MTKRISSELIVVLLFGVGSMSLAGTPKQSDNSTSRLAEKLTEVTSDIKQAFIAATSPFVSTRSETITDAITKQETKTPQYWEATRVKGGGLLIGRGLTIVEASVRVSCGLDIICIDQDAARWLVILNGYWNYVGPEIHPGKGYYWHYHPHRHTHTHIWFYT